MPLAHYAGIVPEKLALLGSEERNRVYEMLRLTVMTYADTARWRRGAF